MKKAFEFGKIDYYGRGRKINKVTVEMELKESDNGPVFTVCGDIWNNRMTDCICGGQCLDTIKEYLPHNKLFLEIHDLWKKYHLNDMNAGKEKQTAAVKDWLAQGNRFDYTEVCKYLESIGLLYEDGYKYGSGWIYRAIPEQDLKRINELMGN